jgi:hypothetical protein
VVRVRAEFDDKGFADTFLREVARMREELRGAVSDVAGDAELIYAAHALFKTGRMSRGVKATVAGDTALVRVDAVDPRTGFDYVAVTRFGHRVRRIVPRHEPKDGRYIAPIPNVGPRWVSKRAALKTPFGFRASVRGFHPAQDWAALALPDVQKAAEDRMAALGRGFAVRVGT